MELLVDFLIPAATVNATVMCHDGLVVQGSSQEAAGTALERYLVVALQGQTTYGSRNAWFGTTSGWVVFDHPPYSLPFVSSDFHLFGTLKKHMKGRNFRTDDKIQQAALLLLPNLEADFFYASFDMLIYNGANTLTW